MPSRAWHGGDRRKPHDISEGLRDSGGSGGRAAGAQRRIVRQPPPMCNWMGRESLADHANPNECRDKHAEPRIAESALGLLTRLGTPVFLRRRNDFVGNRLGAVDIVHLQPARFTGGLERDVAHTEHALAQ